MRKSGHAILTMVLAGFLAIFAAAGIAPAQTEEYSDSETTKTIPIEDACKYCEGEKSMTERAGAITFKGNPMTLVGNEVKEGDKAPAFKVVGNDLSDIALSDCKGKILVVSVVPSVDTGVCAIQTKKFNEEASKQGDDVVILTVSLDLPFAQKRFCGAEGIEAVMMGSDYKYHEFAENYGVLIKELGLLARAVFVIDKDGKVIHREIVSEATNEPDYDAAMAAVKKAQ